MTMSSVLLCGSASFYRLKSVEIELKMLTFSCRPSCLTVSHFIALKQSIRKGSVCSIQNPLHDNPTAESKLRSQETHGITDHHRIKMCSPHCRTQLLNILLLLPVLTLSLFTIPNIPTFLQYNTITCATCNFCTANSLRFHNTEISLLLSIT